MTGQVQVGGSWGGRAGDWIREHQYIDGLETHEPGRDHYAVSVERAEGPGAQPPLADR